MCFVSVHVVESPRTTSEQLSVGKKSILMVCIRDIIPCTFLHVDDPPRIITHPQELRDVVPGTPVTFTAETT